MRNKFIILTSLMLILILSSTSQAKLFLDNEQGVFQTFAAVGCPEGSDCTSYVGGTTKYTFYLEPGQTCSETQLNDIPTYKIYVNSKVYEQGQLTGTILGFPGKQITYTYTQPRSYYIDARVSCKGYEEVLVGRVIVTVNSKCIDECSWNIDTCIEGYKCADTNNDGCKEKIRSLSCPVSPIPTTCADRGMEEVSDFNTCLGSAVYVGNKICCEKGKKITNQCVDTDTADDTLLAGTAKDGFTSISDYCDQNRLFQAYCDGNYAKAKPTTLCENGCSGGACKKSENQSDLKCWIWDEAGSANSIISKYNTVDFVQKTLISAFNEFAKVLRLPTLPQTNTPDLANLEFRGSKVVSATKPSELFRNVDMSVCVKASIPIREGETDIKMVYVDPDTGQEKNASEKYVKKFKYTFPNDNAWKTASDGDKVNALCSETSQCTQLETDKGFVVKCNSPDDVRADIKQLPEGAFISFKEYLTTIGATKEELAKKNPTGYCMITTESAGFDVCGWTGWSPVIYKDQCTSAYLIIGMILLLLLLFSGGRR